MVEFLYRALDSALGIAIITGDPLRFRQQLYAARRAAANPDFDVLSFVVPEAPGELWIVKNPPKDPAP